MAWLSDNSPILIDFGLSKQYDAKGDATSTLIQGVSQGFSPIELYNMGEIATFSPQSDVYSLAATLFYLLTATVPPSASQIIQQGIQFPDYVSPGIREAISRAMATRKSDRPASVTALLGFLHTSASYSYNTYGIRNASETGQKKQGTTTKNDSDETEILGGGAKVPPPPHSPNQTNNGYTNYEDISNQLNTEPKEANWTKAGCVLAFFLIIGIILLVKFSKGNEPSISDSNEEFVEVGYIENDSNNVIIEETTIGEQYGTLIDTVQPNYSNEKSQSSSYVIKETEIRIADDKDLDTHNKNNNVYTAAEQAPSFPYGDEALLAFIAANIHYPPIPAELNIEGRVVVKFVVTKTGDIGDVEILRGRDPDLDKEAIRVVKQLPRFNPGLINGKPVDCWFTIPIHFKLQR